MKIHDISQELFSCTVYPGDEAPHKREDMRMARGDLYNLTSLSLCAHNGTHIDAPFHFLREGKTVEQLDLERLVGPAWVVRHEGMLTAADARRMLETARAARAEAARRLLVRGEAVVTLEAAEVFAAENLFLLGVESQSVGPLEAPMAVHKALLGAEVVLLEGVRLTDIEEGAYFLSAAPLSLSGADGAPCRAILIEYPIDAI